MKQVVQNLKSGEVYILEAPPPSLRAGGALVATQASLLSPGTERSKVEMGRKSLIGKARARPDLARQVIEKARSDGLRETYETVMHRLEAPTPMGYSSCGEVVAVAQDCAGLKPGDLVACAGAGYANHAEVNFVPRRLIAKVPQGVSAEEGAYGTLGAIALQGIRQADLGLGEWVGVIGLGLVGLLTVQIARASGLRVFAVDVEADACQLAADLGAERSLVRHEDVHGVVRAVTGDVGLDGVIVCASTSSNDPVELSAALCRDRGRVVVVGAVGIDIPREPFYRKELELRLSRSYGPGRYDPGYEERGHDYPIGYVRWTEQRNIEEFLHLLATGVVDVKPLTTHRFPVTAAKDAYTLIVDAKRERSKARPIGVILKYADSKSATDQVRLPRPKVDNRAPAEDGRVRIAFVGAGNFATRVLLPALARDDRVIFHGIASAGGASAQQAAKRFGFELVTNDVQGLVDDPDVDAVFIASRHDSHAPYVVRALRSGKAVFCEKPLATTWEDLRHVLAAYVEAPGPLLVGFNRRFSPLTRRLSELLPRDVPRAIVCRVNAGAVPDDHWTKDPVAGGGRIVGELCHFLDLACHFAEGRPSRVSAYALGGSAPLELSESVVAQVAFSCGSVASIEYLANGDRRVPKERIEVFCGGSVFLIDDFKALQVARGGKLERSGGRRSSKGHREEVRAFLDWATGGEASVLTAEDAFWSSALTLQVPVALGLGGPVEVALTPSPASATAT